MFSSKVILTEMKFLAVPHHPSGSLPTGALSCVLTFSDDTSHLSVEDYSEAFKPFLGSVTALLQAVLNIHSLIYLQ